MKHPPEDKLRAHSEQGGWLVRTRNGNWLHFPHNALDTLLCFLRDEQGVSALTANILVNFAWVFDLSEPQLEARAA